MGSNPFYTDEFKANAVALSLKTSAYSAAKHLGCSKSIILRWAQNPKYRFGLSIPTPNLKLKVEKRSVPKNDTRTTNEYAPIFQSLLSESPESDGSNFATEDEIILMCAYLMNVDPNELRSHIKDLSASIRSIRSSLGLTT